MSEQEKAEQLKKELYYGSEFDCGEDEEEIEYETCDYNGEECIGNKMFCEECPVLVDKEEVEEVREWAKREKESPLKFKNTKEENKNVP